MTTRSVTILTIVTCLAALALAAFGMGLLDVGEGILVALSIASLTGGSMVALLLLHGHRIRSLSERAGEQVHPGINLSRIPVAGIPGFVFAVGFVWMLGA